jgi:hypothetical protein
LACTEAPGCKIAVYPNGLAIDSFRNACRVFKCSPGCDEPQPTGTGSATTANGGSNDATTTTTTTTTKTPAEDTTPSGTTITGDHSFAIGKQFSAAVLIANFLVFAF